MHLFAKVLRLFAIFAMCYTSHLARMDFRHFRCDLRDNTLAIVDVHLAVREKYQYNCTFTNSHQ